MVHKQYDTVETNKAWLRRNPMNNSFVLTSAVNLSLIWQAAYSTLMFVDKNDIATVYKDYRTDHLVRIDATMYKLCYANMAPGIDKSAMCVNFTETTVMAYYVEL